MRALACHQASHRPCPQCGEFSGNLSALDAHLWSEHRCGSPRPQPGMNSSSIFTRGDGRTFQVIHEAPYSPRSLEDRFPGATILWPSGNCSGAPADRQVAAEDLIEEVSLPEDCKVFLILGATGSGKSRVLRTLSKRSQAFCGGGVQGYTEGGIGVSDLSEAWAADHSILDAFGDGGDGGLGFGLEGMMWLAAAGLGSVPLWCQPYQALSTGEAFRATLARKLQRAHRQHVPLVVDDMCQHLDPVTARCCSATLRRHLNGAGSHIVAYLASSHADIAHWLQPDCVIYCRAGLPPLSLRNSLARVPWPLRIDCYEHQKELQEREEELPAPQDVHAACRPSTFSNGMHVRSKVSTRGGEAALWSLRRCGLRIASEHCYEQVRDFAHEPEEESVTAGGVVLACRVVTSTATELCDELFDSPTDGIAARRLPVFPTAQELSEGPMHGSSRHLLRAGFSLGLITGRSGAAKSATLVTYFRKAATISWRHDQAVRLQFGSQANPACPPRDYDLDPPDCS